MREVAKYSYCFVCGDKNEDGLRVKFLADRDHAVAHYEPQEKFQGYKGILHGGISATLLDEIMIKAVYAYDVVAVTAEMTVRFKKPVRLSDKLDLTARVVQRKKRFYCTEGEIHDANGELLAAATGKYLIVTGRFEEELQESLED